MSWEHTFEAVRQRASEAGISLAAAGRVGWYDALVPAEYRLPALGGPDRLVIVLGNTRALWGPFTAALAASPALREGDDPLDRWVVETLEAIFSATIERAWESRYSHEGPPRRIAFQRLADAVRLARMGPSLVVHPALGPWIALRAAVVVDLVGPEAPAPLPHPCEGCRERPCVPAMEAALSSERRDLARFLPVRDACPLGRAHRYGPHQLAYHYGRSRRDLVPDD